MRDGMNAVVQRTSLNEVQLPPAGYLKSLTSGNGAVKCERYGILRVCDTSTQRTTHGVPSLGLHPNFHPARC